jgi:polyisoprenoid-binding protein YceI
MMFTKPFTLLVVGLVLTTAACSSVSSSAPPQDASPTAALSTAVPTAPAGALDVTPTATASAPAPTAPASMPDAVATPAPSASGAGGDIRYALSPDGSQASYRVREQLAGKSFPSDAVGVTKAVSGTVVLDQNGNIVSDQSKFVVNLTTLRSDESRRDNFIQRNTLETSRYPTAEFVPTEIRGLPSPLPTSGDVSFQLVGDLTVHGVTRPATWQATAHVAGQDVTGTASTDFTFEDFNMTVPRAFVVLSVNDAIHLELDFHLVRQS